MFTAESDFLNDEFVMYKHYHGSIHSIFLLNTFQFIFCTNSGFAAFYLRSLL